MEVNAVPTWHKPSPKQALLLMATLKLSCNVHDLLGQHEINKVMLLTRTREGPSEKLSKDKRWKWGS